MARKSISASFNSDEIKAIESVCKKLGITPGKLIKDAVTFWMIQKPLEEARQKDPVLFEQFSEIQAQSTEDGKLPAWIVKQKPDSQLLVSELYPKMLEIISNLVEEHKAYHKLSEKKPKGKPKA